jgi:hypothetical protein
VPRSIQELAKVVRSKNAGPFELALDILFERPEDYEAVRDRELIDRTRIAALYGVPVSEVLRVIFFDPACAVKIVMRRSVPSGSPGDTDVYGAQQHGPLLGLQLDL